mmetsp:Transcript_23183/g.38137  ORF Transcript_23183/g.38137 Transcript_23183/m.38137 type:complete len:214 (-) Transcript_23183:148-789(-)
MLYGYLHGFASSPKSFKARRLQERFKLLGVDLMVPDLNVPSFSQLTYTSALSAMIQLDAQSDKSLRWNLIGSSMGGFLAACFASMFPDRVNSLVLMCPAFSLLDRWPVKYGQEELDRWKQEGFKIFDDGKGEKVPLSYKFLEDAATHPQMPDVPLTIPVLIIHGINDDIVPIGYSRQYAASHTNVRLLEVDDDHMLVKSIDTVADETLKFFHL